MKKQLLSLFVLGLAFSGFTSYAQTNQAKEVTTAVGTTFAVAKLDDTSELSDEMSITIICTDSESDFDYAEYITSLDSLSQTEKDALIKLDKETAPLYENLMDLYLKLATAEADEKAVIEQAITDIEKALEQMQEPLKELLEETSMVAITIAYEESENGEMIYFALPESK